MTITIDTLHVGDSAAVWRSAGFAVDPDGCCRVGAVRIRLTGTGGGITGWSLRGLPAGFGRELDGIPTTRSTSGAVPPAEHANGVTAIDHLVIFSPDLARTVSALSAAGEPPRRTRDGQLGGRSIRQVFFRFGEVTIEVVGPPDSAATGAASLWGVTYTVADIDVTAAFFGEMTGPVKDAVQPGRRISTLRHTQLGMSVRTALISPPILNR